MWMKLFLSTLLAVQTSSMPCPDCKRAGVCVCVCTRVSARVSCVAGLLLPLLLALLQVDAAECSGARDRLFRNNTVQHNKDLNDRLGRDLRKPITALARLRQCLTHSRRSPSEF